MSRKILITGGCGFIGSHIIEHILKTTDWEIFTLDKLTYAARGFDRVREINAYDDKRVTFFTADMTQPLSSGIKQEMKGVNFIYHLAAETHVDNSIVDPIKFVRANVLGTTYMLEFARQCDNLEAFNYFGTDEVFGPAPPGVAYKEWDRYDSGNPYSAAKAGGEEMCLAYANTYGLPIYISHCMNAFGERQHPEKFIPICIRKILRGEKIIIHGDKTRTKAGSRFYIHARNIADAVMFLTNNYTQRDKYNIVGEKELSNLELAQLIADIMHRPLDYEIMDFHSSRPGHDMRYALDGTKMKELGWEPPVTIEKSLEKVVNWTLANPKWLYDD